MSNLVNLKAQAAMRAEDLRIATKHCEEAAARNHTPSNVAAYQRAQAWEDLCRERAQAANGRVIRASVEVSA